MNLSPKNHACSDCGIGRSKRASGPRCRPCANRHTYASGKGSWILDSSKWTPEFKAHKSEIARQQVIAQGGVPNAKKFKLGESGPLCPNWKGGLTPENQRERASASYVNWRRAVFVRDEFCCQCCNEVGGRLHAHHIRAFATHPEERFDLKNGITLCQTCHIEVAHQQNYRAEPLPEALIRGARMEALVN